MSIVMPASIKVGQQLTAELNVSLANNLLQAPFVLFYDPSKFDYVSISEGQFLKRDGKETTFSVSADTSFGAVTVNMSRKPGSGGVSGSGTLAYAVFRAKQPGSANFSLGSVKFVSADGKPYEMPHFGNAIKIEP
jgi:general secretion pathway protein D